MRAAGQPDVVAVGSGDARPRHRIGAVKHVTVASEPVTFDTETVQPQALTPEVLDDLADLAGGLPAADAAEPDRPAVVEARTRVGDWEGDLIVGRQSRSAVATLVDRASRLTKLVHLPRNHTAQTVKDALREVLGGLSEAVRLSLTWDQGSEMAHHDQLTALLADGVFFACPASPWQRGSNENTNGLLRQYLPKGTDLSVHTADELSAIEDRLNNRPRKVLQWRTPAEVFRLAVAP